MSISIAKENTRLTEELPSLIHRGSIPRSLIDMPGFKFLVATSKDGDYQPRTLLRLSPFGLEFLVRANEAEILEEKATCPIKIFFGGLEKPISNLNVTITSIEPGKDLGCIVKAVFAPDGVLYKESWIKKQKLWACNPTFTPTGTWKNPFLFNDTVFLRLTGFSNDYVEVETSRRNTTILPGMTIAANFTFVNEDRVPISFVVEEIEEKDSARITLRGTPERFNKKTRFALGNYLAEFTKHISYEGILSEGFYVKDFVDNLSFDYTTIKDQKTFQEIIDLRVAGYETDPSMIKDKWDYRSIFIIARWHGKAIGSLRMVYHQDDQKFEQEEYSVRNNNYPENPDTVEVTRITIAKGFRNSGLIQHLITQATMHILTSGRTWLLGSSPAKSLPLYEAAGATMVDSGYTMNKHSKPVELAVIKANTPQIILGLGVGPIFWNLAYRKSYEHLVKANILVPSFWQKCRIKVYSALGFFAEKYKEKQMMAYANYCRKKIQKTEAIDGGSNSAAEK